MPRPGWYRDPEHVAPVRWWDGTAWTAWQADSPRAPYPPPGPVASMPARAPSFSRRAAIVGGGTLALTAAGLTAYGMTLDSRQRAESLAAAKPSALGTPGTSPQETLNLVLDPASRVVRWARMFSAVLPGQPFELVPVTTTSVLFSSYTAALNTAETGWDSKQDGWPSSVTVGVPVKALVDPTSLATTAGSLLALYRDRVGKVAGAQPAIMTESVAGFGDHEAQRASVVARYEEAGRVTTPRLQVTVIQAHPLAHLAWCELLHTHASAETGAAIAASYDSIWIA